MAGAFPATEAGARAIAVAFYAAQIEDDRDRVTTHFDAVTAPSCTCRTSWHKHIGILAKYNETFVGDNYTHVRPGKFIGFSHSAQIEVTYDATADVVQGPQGQIVRRDQATTGIQEVLTLEPNQGVWLVGAVVATQRGRQS